jgi:hypothetical protein
MAKIEEDGDQYRAELIAENVCKQALEDKMSNWFHWQYCRQEALDHKPSLDTIDEMLEFRRPLTRVAWVGMIPYPISHRSQPLNRLLGWRLWRLGHVEYRQGRLNTVRHLKQDGTTGYRYEATLDSGQIIPAHQVVVRHGPQSTLDEFFPDLKDQLQKLASSQPTQTIGRLDKQINSCFAQRYKELGIRQPQKLLSEKIKLKGDPTPINSNRAWRIRIWIEADDLLQHVSWVEYDLHPEWGSIRRRAVVIHQAMHEKQPFRHWVTTRIDFWIRVRCSDGFEFGDWLSNAVERSAPSNNKARECTNALRHNAMLHGRDEQYLDRAWCDYCDKPELDS